MEGEGKKTIIFTNVKVFDSVCKLHCDEDAVVADIMQFWNANHVS
jgi:hypothetical protein